MKQNAISDFSSTIKVIFHHATKFHPGPHKHKGLARDLVALEKFNQLTRKSAESSEVLTEKQKDITEE